jgi:hypothetical protein
MSVQTRFCRVLREHFGEDVFRDGVPSAPPDWVRRGMIDPANAERNWAIFRDRFNGVSLQQLAERYGMHPARVHEVLHQVLFTVITGARHGTVRQNAPPPSVLERDCMVVNDHLARRPGMVRLHVDRFAGVGIDPHTPLSQVPDARLLQVRGVGPAMLAEIRRLFPFEPDA